MVDHRPAADALATLTLCRSALGESREMLPLGYYQRVQTVMRALDGILGDLTTDITRANQPRGDYWCLFCQETHHGL